MNYLKEIKWAWQRVFRGYDDRVKWGFDDYFLQITPALKEFCIEELNGTATNELNPARHKVFTETLELIREFEKMNYENYYKNDNEINKLLGFVGSNIGYFWN